MGVILFVDLLFSFYWCDLPITAKSRKKWTKLKTYPIVEHRYITKCNAPPYHNIHILKPYAALFSVLKLYDKRTGLVQ